MRVKVCMGNHLVCPDPRIFSLFEHGTRAKVIKGMSVEDAMRAEIEGLNKFCEAIGCPRLQEERG